MHAQLRPRVLIVSIALLLMDVAAPLRAGAGDDEDRQPNVISPVLIGAAGGAVGFVVGVGLGVASARDCYECEIGPAILGALIGEAAGVALGVHAGNRGQGSLAADLAISGLVLVAGISAFDNSGNAEQLWLLIPAAQLVLTVSMERTVASSRKPKRTAQFGVGPGPDRGLMVGARMSF